MSINEYILMLYLILTTITACFLLGAYLVGEDEKEIGHLFFGIIVVASIVPIAFFIFIYHIPLMLLNFSKAVLQLMKENK